MNLDEEDNEKVVFKFDKNKDYMLIVNWPLDFLAFQASTLVAYLYFDLFLDIIFFYKHLYLYLYSQRIKEWNNIGSSCLPSSPVSGVFVKPERDVDTEADLRNIILFPSILILYFVHCLFCGET